MSRRGTRRDRESGPIFMTWTKRVAAETDWTNALAVGTYGYKYGVPKEFGGAVYGKSHYGEDVAYGDTDWAAEAEPSTDWTKESSPETDWS